jgi:hypothetical protein
MPPQRGLWEKRRWTLYGPHAPGAYAAGLYDTALLGGSGTRTFTCRADLGAYSARLYGIGEDVDARQGK